MFGFKKAQKKVKLEKTDYKNPEYLKGVVALDAYGYERLTNNQFMAMTACAYRGGEAFHNMIAAMDETEYEQWLKENLHTV